MSKSIAVASIEVFGALLYLAVWAVLSQHLYCEMLHEPEKSWVNMVRLWWVTRHSERKIRELRKVWDGPRVVEEPTPQED